MHSSQSSVSTGLGRSFKELIKRSLLRLGYQVIAVPSWSRKGRVADTAGYRLVDWKKADGSYDVGAYQREQEAGNRAKLTQVWTNESNLRFLAGWLQARGAQPSFVVCHGTRNGFEQGILADAFGCETIGTEISSTAQQFPRTIQADFHEPPAEWDGRVDVVYSNSLDHAYDPAKALRAWARSLKQGGFIVLDKASDSDPHGVTDLDPFGIDLPQLLLFIFTALGETASIEAVLDVPQPKADTTYHKMIVVRVGRRAA